MKEPDERTGGRAGRVISAALLTVLVLWVALALFVLLQTAVGQTAPTRLCYCEREGSHRQCHYDVPEGPRRLCWDEA